MEVRKATCFYCEFYDFYYVFRYDRYYYCNYGNCKCNNNRKFHDDDICENFKLRLGLHTNKWYPGKEEKN